MFSFTTGNAAHTISGVGVTVPTRSLDLGMDEGTTNYMHDRLGRRRRAYR